MGRAMDELALRHYWHGYYAGRLEEYQDRIEASLPSVGEHRPGNNVLPIRRRATDKNEAL